MPTIVLVGHSYLYAVSDLLRMFSHEPVRVSDHQVISGNGDDVIIYSQLTEDEVCTYIPGGILEQTSRRDLTISEKREIKRQLYIILSRVYEKSFPWGSLTGIRPTIVAREEKSPEVLSERYFVRPDKASLACKVANEEDAILAKTDPKGFGMYIGVPFCPSRCSYCSFIAYDTKATHGLLEQYAESLLAEVRTFFSQTKIRPEYLYFGGGTPSVFDNDLFLRLYDEIFRLIPGQRLREISFEAGRSDTVTPEKLRFLKEMNVDRICINPQTTSDQTLQRIGRNHTASDFYRAFETARNVGFRTVNTDLIAGLPGESEADFQTSLKDVLSLSPENITVHALAKKRRASLSSSFHLLTEQEDEKKVDRMMEYAQERLLFEGYDPYYLYRQKDTLGGLENTGYTKKNHACSYNVAMMSDQRSVIGFGAGSMSKRIFTDRRLERCANVKDPREYNSRSVEMAEKKAAFFRDCE